eukprot:7724354-Pyramimonas_sp.AAC.1
MRTRKKMGHEDDNGQGGQGADYEEADDTDTEGHGQQAEDREYREEDRMMNHEVDEHRGGQQQQQDEDDRQETKAMTIIGVLLRSRISQGLRSIDSPLQSCPTGIGLKRVVVMLALAPNGACTHGVARWSYS